MPYRRILCATDFHDRTRHALESATALAARGGAHLTLVHVLPVPRSGWPEIAPEARFAESLHRLAEANLADWKRAAEVLRGQPIDAVLLEGVPWERIVKQASAEGSDLIVVGAHGASGLERVYFGATAERVVRHAPCQVLVVR